VADYANISILEAEQLPLDLFLLYLRDGFIHYNRQFEAGRAYLEECWYLEQTEPDRNRLRDQYGKEAD